jgi:integrase
VRQQGQVLALKSTGADGQPLWAYRFRRQGRGSPRVQRGGFLTERDARAALHSELERLARRRHRREVTLAELVEEYLGQHEAQPETTAKLRWLLSKSVARFGTRPLDELEAREIAAWRMTIPAGHRFEATQALRQVLARAVLWELIDSNPAKLGVTNPVPVRREMRPFESWEEIHAVATAIGPRHAPLVIFAAATGLRPGEWIALEHRDIGRDANVVHVRRAYRNGRVKTTKTYNSTRAVPLQSIAARALDRLPANPGPTDLVFPAPHRGHFDLHNFRNRHWKPAQHAAGIQPPRRVYDLRHTFATFALRAGVSTFDLSRYMGTSLTMIDRHYGHLAHDARQHVIDLLDRAVDAGGRPVDAGVLSPRAPGTNKVPR